MCDSGSSSGNPVDTGNTGNPGNPGNSPNPSNNNNNFSHLNPSQPLSRDESTNTLGSQISYTSTDIKISLASELQNAINVMDDKSLTDSEKKAKFLSVLLDYTMSL